MFADTPTYSHFTIPCWFKKLNQMFFSYQLRICHTYETTDEKIVAIQLFPNRWSTLIVLSQLDHSIMIR